MNKKVSIAVAVILMAAVAMASEAPLIDAHITSLTTAKEIREGRGPIDMTFNVTATNNSTEPVTMTRVSIRTDDTSGFTLRDGSMKVNMTIQPQGTANFDISARRVGSKALARSATLKISVDLSFKSANGKFVKSFSEFIQ